jgi:hypothetical protein
MPDLATADTRVQRGRVRSFLRRKFFGVSTSFQPPATSLRCAVRVQLIGSLFGV